MLANKTILIADDRSFDRDLLSKSLARKLGCKIRTAASGPEALHALASQSIDLLLLDIEMPEMSGEETLLQIRKKRTMAELPIIMVSGNSKDASIISCLEAGANDYITKPVNLGVAAMRIANQFSLAEAIQVRGKLQEMAALHAIIVAVNHEINNPLTIAMAMHAKLGREGLSDNVFRKLEKALIRIQMIVKKIQSLSDETDVTYETYIGTTKMVKLK